MKSKRMILIAAGVIVLAAGLAILWISGVFRSSETQAAGPKKATLPVINYVYDDDFRTRCYEKATPEQKKELDRIISLCHGFTNPRQMAITVGDLPKDTPRLTPEQAKEICAKLLSEQHPIGGNDTSYDRTIAAAFDAIAGAPDFYGGSGLTWLEYYLSDTGEEYLRLFGSYVTYRNKTTGEQETLLGPKDRIRICPTCRHPFVSQG